MALEEVECQVDPPVGALTQILKNPDCEQGGRTLSIYLLNCMLRIEAPCFVDLVALQVEMEALDASGEL